MVCAMVGCWLLLWRWFQNLTVVSLGGQNSKYIRGKANFKRLLIRQSPVSPRQSPVNLPSIFRLFFWWLAGFHSITIQNLVRRFSSSDYKVWHCCFLAKNLLCLQQQQQQQPATNHGTNHQEHAQHRESKRETPHLKQWSTTTIECICLASQMQRQ